MDSFASEEKLEDILESCAVRLSGNQDRYRGPLRRIKALLKRQRNVCLEFRWACRGLFTYFWPATYLPTSEAFSFIGASRISAIRAADGCILLDIDGQRDLEAESLSSFAWWMLQTLKTVNIDTSIDETKPSLSEVKEVAAWFRGGRVPCICKISTSCSQRDVKSWCVS